MAIRTTYPAWTYQEGAAPRPRRTPHATSPEAPVSPWLAHAFVYGLIAIWALLALFDPLALRGDELTWVGAACAYVFVAIFAWTGTLAALVGMTRAVCLSVTNRQAGLRPA